jgi:hypothetical protein
MPARTSAFVARYSASDDRSLPWIADLELVCQIADRDLFVFC